MTEILETFYGCSFSQSVISGPIRLLSHYHFASQDIHPFVHEPWGGINMDDKSRMLMRAELKEHKNICYILLCVPKVGFIFTLASNRSEVRNKLETEDIANKIRSACPNLKLLNFVLLHIYLKPQCCNSRGIYHWNLMTCPLQLYISAHSGSTDATAPQMSKFSTTTVVTCMCITKASPMEATQKIAHFHYCSNIYGFMRTSHGLFIMLS